MPKTYSEKERTAIIRRLKKEADRLIREKGVKKTTVDELVQRAGIPKGTFYLFFPSKEMLFFELTQDLHEQVDDHINKGMEKILDGRSPDEADLSGKTDEVTDVILGAVNITMKSSLRVMLQPDSMALILDKLPKDATLYAAGWWQEPMVTLILDRKMKNLYSISPRDFLKKSYFYAYFSV